jgi:hypothetical protein
MCVDYWCVPTPKDALEVDSPFVSRLSFEQSGPPDTLHVTVAPAVPHNRFLPDRPCWTIAYDVASYDLPLQREQDIQLGRIPGQYVLSVWASWEGIGDVNYGFLVEVMP